MPHRRRSLSSRLTNTRHRRIQETEWWQMPFFFIYNIFVLFGYPFDYFFIIIIRQRRRE